MLQRVKKEEAHEKLEPRPVLAEPVLPERTLENLRQLIENLEDEDGKQIAAMVGAYQVQRSRLHSLLQDYKEPKRHGVEHLMNEGYVVDVGLASTLEVQWSSNRMLPFARNQVGHIPEPAVTAENLQGAYNYLELEPVLTDQQMNRLRNT
jgi:hypothetical protein